MASLESARDEYYFSGLGFISRYDLLNNLKLNDLDKFLIFEIFKHITDYQSFENLRLVNKEFYTLVKHYFGHLNFHQDLVRDNKINVPLNINVLKINKIKESNYDIWLKRRVCDNYNVRKKYKNILSVFTTKYKSILYEHNPSYYSNILYYKEYNVFTKDLINTFHKKTIEKILNYEYIYSSLCIDSKEHLEIHFTAILIMNIGLDYMLKQRKVKKRTSCIEKWLLIKNCKKIILQMLSIYSNKLHIIIQHNLRSKIVKTLNKHACVAFTLNSFIINKHDYHGCSDEDKLVENNFKLFIEQYLTN